MYLPLSLETGGLMVMLKFADALAAGDPESLTWTINVEAPWAVGVPVIDPEVARLSLAGKEPDGIVQV
jgi:hypothetical protein